MRTGDEQHPGNTAQGRGERSDDQKRVKPGLKIHHDEQINQKDGKGSPLVSPINEEFIVSTSPRILLRTPGQLFAGVRPPPAILSETLRRSLLTKLP